MASQRNDTPDIQIIGSIREFHREKDEKRIDTSRDIRLISQFFSLPLPFFCLNVFLAYCGGGSTLFMDRIFFLGERDDGNGCTFVVYVSIPMENESSFYTCIIE